MRARGNVTEGEGVVLVIGGVIYRPSLIVFDKDGTLVDFHYLWGTWSVAYLRAIVNALEDGERLWTPLCRTLGYDADAQRILRDSPLATEPADGLAKVTATVLYQEGVPWTRATEVASNCLPVAQEELSLRGLVRSVGDVPSLFRRLRRAGVRIGIATTDQRDLTLAVMDLIGVTELVDHFVCGDDGVEIKPAPDMVLAICAALGIPPEESIVVGDTTADMIMGRRAKVQLRVGVLTGVALKDDLVPHSDVILDSIHDIAVR